MEQVMEQQFAMELEWLWQIGLGMELEWLWQIGLAMELG
ncbi:hypothetical protein BpHYR1_051818 [Brachionus plicatilis]|uniref:Uncharacterized protein n=1 Tax=Brachionus plicatilis TaxID=10195 RepID=A0A3M7P4W3_BRAPC|nr:hypothetical protein BpHYR1_051818 [Brachionus plicatilis]